MKAKRIFILSLLGIVLLVSGCTVLSFYPLYTDDVLIRNDTIIGKWQTVQEAFSKDESNDTLVWNIVFKKKRWIKKLNSPFDRGERQVPNKYVYSLVLYDKSVPDRKCEFELHLVRLNGETFIDFYPEEWDPDNFILGFHLIGVHTFAKVEIKTGSLIINWFNSEWFANKLKNKKIRIKHETNSANILLTAKPKELQKFVEKYAGDQNAFDESSRFELKPLE